MFASIFATLSATVERSITRIFNANINLVAGAAAEKHEGEPQQGTINLKKLLSTLSSGSRHKLLQFDSLTLVI